MADFLFWPVVVDSIFRTQDAIHRLLILVSSGLYLTLYNNGRFLILDIWWPIFNFGHLVADF